MTLAQDPLYPHTLVTMPGSLIRRKRRKLGIKQKELARAAGISPNVLCRFEKGHLDLERKSRLALWAALLLHDLKFWPAPAPPAPPAPEEP